MAREVPGITQKKGKRLPDSSFIAWGKRKGRLGGKEGKNDNMGGNAQNENGITAKQKNG